MTVRRLWAVVAKGMILACTTDIAVGPQRITALAVSPDSISMPVGDTVRLQSVATDAQGIRFVGLPTEWSVTGSTAVATISRSGAVVGLTVGTTAITAASRGLTATAQVTVTPPPIIVTSSDTVTFTGVANGPLPAPQTVVVTNGGGGMLEGLSETITYEPGASGWLAVTHSATIAPDTLTLADTTTALASGVYIARVLVRARRASNNPDTVLVRLVLSAGTPTQVAADSGIGQSAPVNTTVAVPPTVLVRDQFDNPVPGVPVTFAVVAGTGSVTGATDTTDATGRARVGSWRLGTSVGVNTLNATAAPLPGAPVIFTATATAGAPSQLVKTAGDGQTATVNTAVATPPAVRVEDQFGNPVSGTSVAFAPTAGSGSVTAGVAIADPSGVAAAGTWTVGTDVGTDTLVASAGTVSVRFTAIATVAAAAQIVANAGNDQSATVNTTVATPPSVRVSDQFGNPVAGIEVLFTIFSGGGSITGPADTSDASGLARVGSWTLGTAAGTNTLRASAGSLAGSPVTFTATGIAGAPASLAKQAGDGQSAPVGTAVPIAPTVLVQDAFNNPVSGVQVTFSVAPGNGSLTGAVASTDAAGVATVGSWTLGSTAKVDTLTASVSGLPAVAFTATATAGGAGAIARVSAAARTDTIGAAFADSVRVTDGSGNPVSGVNVTFAAGGAGSFTPAIVATNAAGIAASTRTLGTATGTVTDTAKATGLSGSPVLFTTTTTSGRATTLGIAGGNNQTDTVGQTLAVPYTVLVTDRAGNGVPGASVSFAITTGSGAIDGGADPVATSTGATGQASVTRTLGTTAGTQTVTATSGTLTGSPQTFIATAVNDAPTQIAVSAGNNQSATVGTPVPTPPQVRVTDQFANPVAGVIVTFSSTPRSGSVTKPVDTTDVAGLATVGSWTLGTTVGPDTLSATSSQALAGSPVLFLATGISGSATTMAAAGGDAQSDTVRATLPTQYAVRVTDGGSNPVQDVTVSWAVTQGGGSITPTSLTDASGIARATRVLGDTAGNQGATGSVGGLTGSPVTFIATANHGNAAQLAKQAGDGQGATVNTTVSVPPAVIVKDAYGNAIAGAGVTFAVTGGGGSGTGLNPTTDASGIATVGSWRLGTAAGPNVLQATSGALTPVTFTATGNPDVPASVAKQAGDGQSATVGTAVSTPPRVLVTDQFGNPVPGVTVSFAVTSGGGTVNGGSVTNVSSSGAGLASVAWTLGTTSGSNTMTATAGALTPATFTATATTGAPQALALQGGDGQADTIGTTLPTPYAVSVADQFGNPVSAVNVTFTITAGGGAINGMAGPVVVATNAGGTASVTRTLGTTAGTQTVQATASVPSGSPVTFTATANPGNPTTIAANSSIGLTGTVNTTVSPIPSVKVTDRGGNGVSGVAVTFAPSSAASGSVMGGSPSTGVTGVATVTSWTLDQIVGNDTLLATSSGLTGSPVRFVAASSPGAVSLSVSTLTASSSQITACNASCTTGGGTASTITATVKDQFGNVIAGRTVTLSSTGTANAFAPGASGTTDASGVFSATFSSTAAQAKTISGSVTGSGTLTQTAAVTVNPDVNTLLGSSVVTATSPIAASSGSTLSTITVTVRDQFLNPVSGRTVTIAVSPVTGNTVTQPGSLTNASGQTTGTFSTTKAETKTATASVNGTGGGSITDNALVTVTAAAASSIVVNAGNSQTVRVGTAVATDPSVLVRDAFLNPVPSASVTFTPSGGGSVTGSPATTDAIGIATVTSWTLGSTGTENADGTFSNSLSASTAGAGSTSFSASAFYTLSGDVQPIYTASCATAGCHVSGGTAPNLSAGSSRASTVGVTATCNPGFQRVQASNATNSVMYRRILDAGICSTFMPPGTSGLNTTQQKIIRAWINNGALNN